MRDSRERPTSNQKIGLPAPSDQIRQALRVSFSLYKFLFKLTLSVRSNWFFDTHNRSF